MRINQCESLFFHLYLSLWCVALQRDSTSRQWIRAVSIRCCSALFSSVLFCSVLWRHLTHVLCRITWINTIRCHQAFNSILRTVRTETSKNENECERMKVRAFVSFPLYIYIVTMQLLDKDIYLKWTPQMRMNAFLVVNTAKHHTLIQFHNCLWTISILVQYWLV